MILLDVNVWLAASVAGHVHHDVAASWFAREERRMLFCRVTQMALLRLLTNPAVMDGLPLTRREAWQVYDSLLGDERIEFAPEPERTETFWRSHSVADDSAHRQWTDDYLLSFAQALGCPLATLDRPLAARAPDVQLIG